MPRLFTALVPPATVQAELAEIAAPLAGVRWTPAENIHLTLRFIGETDDAKAQAKEPVKAAEPGVWTRFMRWLDGHRGHMLTGALSAGAVAAVAFMLRAEPGVMVINTRESSGSGPVAIGPGPDGGGDPMILVATPPEVESLEVSGGTGTVFTIQDDEGGTDTAVIWITPDDVLEGI